MKKILPIFTLMLLLTPFVKAQSLELVNPPEIVYGAPESALITAGFDVLNTTDEPIMGMVRRTIISELENSYNYFCWAQCYSPAVDVAPYPVTIPAGQAVSNFYADYVPMNAIGETVVEYCFYDMDNPDDEICHTVTFSTEGTTGIDDQEALALGSPRPNPATDIAQIPFKITGANQSATIVVYNLVGSEVMRLPVNGLEGMIQLDVNSLQSGIYLYSLMNNNVSMGSKKLIVRN